MTRQQITIIIEGPQDSGKTLLSQHLLHHLAVKCGVAVKLNDGAWSGIPSAAYQALSEHFDADVILDVKQTPMKNNDDLPALPALPMCNLARDLRGDAEVYTAAQLREFISADRAARAEQYEAKTAALVDKVASLEAAGKNAPLPVAQANPASATTPQDQVGVDKDARLGRYVKAFATKGGWDPHDGEGAFEFIQRHSYAVGYEDAGGKPSFGGTTSPSRWPVSAILGGQEIGTDAGMPDIGL